MGASASSVDVNNKEGVIVEYHRKIGETHAQIMKNASTIKKVIEERQYNDKNLICERVIWQNVDELATFFPTVNVKTGNVSKKYKLGIDPEQGLKEFLENKRLQSCANIAAVYKYKIEILDKMLTLKTCASMSKLEFGKLQGMLKEYKEGFLDRKVFKPTENDKWIKIYKELESFNKAILKNYENLLLQINNIRLATREEELRKISNDNEKIYKNISSICSEHADFFRKMEIEENREKVVREERKVKSEEMNLERKIKSENKNVERKINSSLFPQSPLTDDERIQKIRAELMK